MISVRGVLLLVGIAAGLMVGSDLNAQTARRTEPAARPVAPRPDLTAAEQSVTELFEEASPSVAYITSLALRRDFFRLNVMEIPRGTGSGFVWASSAAPTAPR